MAMSLMTMSAQIKIDNEVKDCGMVEYEKPVTAVFTLTNESQRAMRITDVETSCGCTGAEYPQTEIAAGQQFTVKLTYDSRMLGHFHKSALLQSNVSDKPMLLTMKGVVVTELQDYSGTYPHVFGDLLADKNVIEFDDVNKGDSPEQVIYIYNNGTSQMEPNLMHLPSYLTAYSSPQTLMPGRSGKIVLTLNSAKLRDFGLTQTSVYIGRELGERVSSKNEIPVSVVLLPGFVGMSDATRQYAPKLAMSVKDITVDFGNKNKYTEYVVLSNQGRTSLKISSLQLFTEGVKVTLNKRVLEPGESTKLKITANKDQLKKVRTKPRVLMITNDPDNAKVVLELNIK
jgi:hypothetical protein